jgi:hypothetical protein
MGIAILLDVGKASGSGLARTGSETTLGEGAKTCPWRGGVAIHEGGRDARRRNARRMSSFRSCPYGRANAKTVKRHPADNGG